MPNLGREFIERRCEQRQRVDNLSMAVALNDLRRHWRGAQTKLPADVLFEIRRNIGMRSDSARYFADPDVFSRILQPPSMAPQFVVPDRQLEAKCNRFGMHAMRTADHDRRTMLRGL